MLMEKRSFFLHIRDGEVTPAIFSNVLYDELLAAPADKGARVVVWAHAADVLEVPTDEEGVVLNINNPDMLAARSRIGKQFGIERSALVYCFLSVKVFLCAACVWVSILNALTQRTQSGTENAGTAS